MRKIRIKSSTVQRLLGYLWKMCLAFSLAFIFVGLPINAVAGNLCGSVAVGVSCGIIYYILEHVEVVEDGE